MNDKTDEIAADSNGEASDFEHLVMCGYSHGGKKVPAVNVFETSTGAESYCCEQHSSLALTCMKFLRRLNE